MDESAIARITVEVPYMIHKQLKIKAAYTDKSIREVILALLKDFLKE